MNIAEFALPGIPQAYYIPNFITEDEEKYLIRKVSYSARLSLPQAKIGGMNPEHWPHFTVDLLGCPQILNEVTSDVPRFSSPRFRDGDIFKIDGKMWSIIFSSLMPSNILDDRLQILGL